MKYESNILKRLIDAYGVVGNPRYISEIIKEFIVQGKERFPNLFTYQADWLAHIDEFGLNPSYTVSYTGQSIYAPNTLEKPVKSAILTGQTLVNLIASDTIVSKTGGIATFINNKLRVKFANYNWSGITINNTGMFKPSTKYTIIAKATNTTSFTIEIGHNSTSYNAFTPINDGRMVLHSGETGSLKIALTTRDNLQMNTVVYNVMCTENPSSFSGDKFIDVELMIIEGDYTNVNIPYFEGMQSVKVPVLKTNGKNLFDGEFILGKINDDGTNSEIKTMARSKNYTEVKPNTTYNYKWIQMLGASRIFFYDNNKQFISKGDSIPNSGGNFTTPNNCKYIHFHLGNANNFGSDTVQIEQGSTATSYEPYKSNILSTPEDLELRGIGEVRDELNLLTGELTQSLVERVFDGTENWIIGGTGDNYKLFRCESYTDMVKSSNIIVSDKYAYSTLNNASSNLNITYSTTTGKPCIVTSQVDLSLDDFKSKLSVDKPRVQYQLAEKVIKTVDLNILDQNGQNIKQLISFKGGTHFKTGSAEGTPLPVVSVSVETDLEETLKVCSLEGSTL